MKIKKWNGSAWVQEYPEVEVDSIVATGEPGSTTFLRGDGSWATISDSDTTYTAGTGLSLTGTVFANTAPDQTVALTGSGATTVTGTYPNFTISSTDNNTVYTHPTHPGDDINIDTGALTGATVISDLDFNITSDTLGHITDANATIATRTLTAADISAAPIASPALTGTPTAPTANTNTNTTQIATTAFVKSVIAGIAGGLDFKGTISLSGGKNGSQLASAGLSAPGDYLIVTTAGDLVAGGIFGLIVQPPGDESDSTLPVTLEVGDWIFYQEEDGINNTLTVAILNNNDASKAAAVHTHTIANVTGLQTAIDGKLNLTGGTLTGTLTSRSIAMQNYELSGVNSLSFNDPGPNEGISWTGGNFSIYESPNDLTTNSAGNLQFVSAGARRLTVQTDGTVNIPGTLTAGTISKSPVITLTGAVTGSGTMTNLGNVSIATTATADPVLTLAGDATGSATFTNLGNATLTVAIVDDSHNHIISNVDGLQTALDGKLSTSGKAADSNLLDGIDSAAFVRSDTADTIVGNHEFYGTDTGGTYSNAPIEVREVNLVAANQSSAAYAPSIAWHWGGRVQTQMKLYSSGKLTLEGNHTGQVLTTTEGNAVSASTLATARNIALTGAVTGNANFDGSGNISIATTATSDPVITLTGAVTGSGTMTNLGNVSIATTATADPTLTLSGDASGSATFTNLGNATLSVTVNNDSHTHSQVYIPDTRGASRAPNYYPYNNVSFDFQSSTDTGAGGDGWNVLQTVVPWSSYNDTHRQQQLAFTGTGGVKFRYATSDTAWAGWQRLFADDYHPNADTWTTARTLTIGSTGKSVNGSGNVSWSLAEIGAYAASNPSGYITSSASISGNAATATALQTTRSINGTNFNGTANITTANWGTARTLTIGSTGKSVNGSGNVSWSLAEIGALPLSGGTITGNLVTSGANINISQGNYITFYGGNTTFHSIVSRDNAGTIADDLRLNSYGAFYVNLDSNNNNTSDADFMIGRHGNDAGTISELFRVNGETGLITNSAGMEVSGETVWHGGNLSFSLSGTTLTITTS
jgi:hypothetical protein